MVAGVTVALSVSYSSSKGQSVCTGRTPIATVLTYISAIVDNNERCFHRLLDEEFSYHGKLINTDETFYSFGSAEVLELTKKFLERLSFAMTRVTVAKQDEENKFVAEIEGKAIDEFYKGRTLPEVVYYLNSRLTFTLKKDVHSEYKVVEISEEIIAEQPRMPRLSLAFLMYYHSSMHYREVGADKANEGRLKTRFVDKESGQVMFTIVHAQHLEDKMTVVEEYKLLDRRGQPVSNFIPWNDLVERD